MTEQPDTGTGGTQAPCKDGGVPISLGEIETLHYYDCPRIFVFEHDGAPRLANSSDETDVEAIYQVSSPAPDLLDRLRANEADLRDAMAAGPFFTLSWGAEVRIAPAGEPDWLPEPGVKLRCEHDVGVEP
ncbi:hypothetical protein [Defluviimonas salinarum]|uniref:Uncharacterized protein n=1 Tax=Defluviimonas salinarum TaxID=2992147 RepID=A0ABT3J5P2_9RHOB|nr:hypothetical protein [Defluviimonas salinarum]MCW3782993.1 hypothetical protein [Defluviimonas salinarum]